MRIFVIQENCSNATAKAQTFDCCRTNAERAFRIRALEDENTALQIEVLNIRQEKAEVADQLRKEKERLDRFKENVRRTLL